MITSVTEGVELYKAELRRYKAWDKNVKERVQQHKAIHIIADYANWPHRLEGMRQALNMTAEEIGAIDEQLCWEIADETEAAAEKVTEPSHSGRDLFGSAMFPGDGPSSQDCRE